MHENVELFEGVLEGDLAGTLEVNSPVEAFEGTVALDLANTRYYGRRLGDGRAVLRFVDGEAMILQKTVLRGALGVTEAEGTWHFDGPLNYRFRLSRGSLAELVGPARAQKLDVAGDLTLSAKVGGDTTMTTVTAYLTSPAITFAGKNLGATHLEARVQGRDVQVWGKPFEGARTTMRLKVKEPYPWELSAHLALPEIQPLLPKGAISKGVSGAISGTFDAKGNLRDMKAMEGGGTVDRFTLTRGDFSGANEGRIDLAWKNGALRMDQFRFRGPNTALSIAGSAGPSRLDLDVHGTFDMRLLESFVPQLERTGGKVEITVAARGTPEAPSLAGAAALQEGRLTIRDQPLSVRGLSGRLEFSDTRLLVQDVHGALNDGRVALDADIRLERFSPKFLQIRMQVDRVTIRPMDDLVVVTDGELHLAGRPDALTLSGDLDLSELLYRRPLALEALVTNIRTARVSVVAPDAPRKDWLAFDVAVHARSNVRVDNNLAKGRLRGDLRLTGTNTRPGLLGTIEAQEGSQIFFRGNTFSVSQALLEFKDRREIDPVFDLHAQTSAREYVVNLHAFGRAQDPQVILTSDPDLPEGDILSLLTFGITSRDKSDTMSAAGAVAGEAIFNATGLDKQVQRFLPRNPILRDLSFHISSTYNESTGTVVPTAQLESKFLTEKLKLGMSQPMGTGRGTRASAEYRFDDRLSTQFQWDNERGEELPNFGVDLKLRWEME
jgi:translocation and assembly module TamB